MTEASVWRARLELALAALAKISVHCEITEDSQLREEIDDAVNGYLTACNPGDREWLLARISDFREQATGKGEPSP